MDNEFYNRSALISWELARQKADPLLMRVSCPIIF